MQILARFFQSGRLILVNSRVAQASVNSNPVHSESTPRSTSQDVFQGPNADGGNVSHSHFPTGNMSNSSEAFSDSNLHFNTPSGNNSSDHSNEEAGRDSPSRFQLPVGSFSKGSLNSRLDNLSSNTVFYQIQM